MSELSPPFTAWICEVCRLEAAYYPGEAKVVIINNSDFEIASRISDASGRYLPVNLKAYGLTILDVLPKENSFSGYTASRNNKGFRFRESFELFLICFVKENTG